MPQTKHAGKPIRFPDITSFEQIFPETAPWYANLEVPPIMSYCWVDDEKGELRWQVVSRYVAIDRGVARDTKKYGARTALHLSPRVLDYVYEEMIRVDYDSIYFRITIWDDGRALVEAMYNQIIGSHYLAIIDAATIPCEA